MQRSEELVIGSSQRCIIFLYFYIVHIPRQDFLLASRGLRNCSFAGTLAALDSDSRPSICYNYKLPRPTGMESEVMLQNAAHCAWRTARPHG